MRSLLICALLFSTSSAAFAVLPSAHACHHRGCLPQLSCQMGGACVASASLVTSSSKSGAAGIATSRGLLSGAVVGGCVIAHSPDFLGQNCPPNQLILSVSEILAAYISASYSMTIFSTCPDEARGGLPAWPNTPRPILSMLLHPSSIL